jgi:RNA polymerase sigma-70 factor (ECF subfamily)
MKLWQNQLEQRCKPETGTVLVQEPSFTGMDRLYEDYYARARAYARKMVGPEDADDVVQEAFLRIARYRAADLATVDAHFVLAVTRNVAFSAMAQAAQELRRRTAHSGGRPSSHESKVHLSEGVAERYLDELTDGQREALILVEAMGLSETQASIALHVSRPVVNAKKRSAVMALRAKVTRGGSSAA